MKPRLRAVERLSPAQPRREQDRAEYIVKFVPSVADELQLLEKLGRQATEWQQDTDAALKAVAANPTLLKRPSLHRLVRVLQVLVLTSSPTLVFCGWRQTLEALMLPLQRLLGQQVAEFSCRVAETSLQVQAGLFQRGKARILVCDELGGEGRNFQRADQIIHVDLPWTPAQLEQRIGRVDRIGRAGKVTSIVPFASDRLEHDLFNIWHDAFCLFTESMSGLEIALEKIQGKLVKALATPEGSQHALRLLLEPLKAEAAELRKQVALDRYSEETTDKRLQHEFTRLTNRYDDGNLLREALLGWVKANGLPGVFTTGDGTVRVKTDLFTPQTLAQHRFYGLSAVSETLKRANRLQGKASEFEGTFDRKVAVEREDLVFFAPGSDPWTAKIVAHALEADRGRVAGVLRKLPHAKGRTLVFELLYAVKANPRPLFAAGYSDEWLNHVAGYLPDSTLSLWINHNGKLITPDHKLWPPLAKPYDRQSDFSLSATKNPALHQTFRSLYSDEEWRVILQRVQDTAQTTLHNKTSISPEQLNQLQRELEQMLLSRRTGETTSIFTALADRQLGEALVASVKTPDFRLESVKVWWLEGVPSA